MKLLSKKTLQTEISHQRQSQINDGVMLAKKVDALRQTLSNLEKQHADFVGGMKSNMENTLKGLEDGIMAKRAELVSIESERQKLIAPLDTAWAELHRKEEEVAEINRGIMVMQQTIEREKDKWTILTTKERERLATIKLRERELSRVYATAEDELTVIHETLRKTTEEKEKQQEKFTRAFRLLRTREDEYEQKLVAIQNQKIRNDSHEQELIGRERLLQDRYRTLERNIKRNT